MLAISFSSDTRMRAAPPMKRQGSGGLARPVPSTISLTGPCDPNRNRVEAVIEAAYARRYGAIIGEHYPMLMHASDRDGRVLAAVGFRRAADDALYLERYLDRPIEEVLERMTGAPVDRCSIVEIGNLASTGRGAAASLIVALAGYLQRQDLSIAVVTATKKLRRSLVQFGVDFVELAAAQAEALPDRGASWGSYYACNPKVVAGTVPGPADRPTRLGRFVG